MSAFIASKRGTGENVSGTGSASSPYLFGFAFHISWICLILYANQPIGTTDPFAIETATVFGNTQSWFYFASFAALVLVLACFAVRPALFLQFAQHKTVTLAAAIITALGTLAYCLTYYFSYDLENAGLVIISVSGIVTGIGSAMLAMRWAHAFEIAKTHAILKTTPTILAVIIAICIIVPYLTFALELICVVAFPILSGVFAMLADNEKGIISRKPEAIFGRQIKPAAVYGGIVIGLLALGLILGVLEISTTNSLYTQYLVFFYITAIIAVIAACGIYIYRNFRKDFPVSFIMPICIIVLAVLLYLLFYKVDFFSSLLPIGLECLEMIIFIMTVILALRFGLTAVRTFAIGRITFAVFDYIGNYIGTFLVFSTATAFIQLTSFILFAGIELLLAAGITVIVLSIVPAKSAAPASNDLKTSNEDGKPKGERFRVKVGDFAKYYKLSARETEVAEELLKGLTYSKIQQDLNIAEGTVNYHTRNIYAKTNVHNKTELIDLFDSFDSTKSSH
ncbi:MAG: helix-turn-helix transcriptional regulator [Eggerthellaceae bacterium]|nr:helix-turn-helix transcriptional regulator [Eggerthellaceae bacterium]